MYALAAILAHWSNWTFEEMLEQIQTFPRIQIIDCGSPSGNIVAALDELGYYAEFDGCPEMPDVWNVYKGIETMGAQLSGYCAMTDNY